MPTAFRLEPDANGRATVRRLLPGPHKVSCHMPGIGGIEREIAVGPGETEIELVLR